MQTEVKPDSHRVPIHRPEDHVQTRSSASSLEPLQPFFANHTAEAIEMSSVSGRARGILGRLSENSTFVSGIEMSLLRSFLNSHLSNHSHIDIANLEIKKQELHESIAKLTERSGTLDRYILDTRNRISDVLNNQGGTSASADRIIEELEKECSAMDLRIMIALNLLHQRN